MAQSYNGDQIGQGPCLISAGHLLAEGGNRLLPEERAVEVWPASGEPRRLEQAAVLEAGAEFPGLQLELGEIWAGSRCRLIPACTCLCLAGRSCR